MRSLPLAAGTRWFIAAASDNSEHRAWLRWEIDRLSARFPGDHVKYPSHRPMVGFVPAEPRPTLRYWLYRNWDALPDWWRDTVRSIRCRVRLVGRLSLTRIS